LKTFSEWSQVALAALLVLGAPVVPAVADDTCDQDVQTCLDQFVRYCSNRGWVGLELDLDEATNLRVVTRVVPESPAEAAGFAVGDLLVGFNGLVFAETDKTVLDEAKEEHMRPGHTVTWLIERDGEHLELETTLAKVPHEVLAAWVGNHMLAYHASAQQAP